MLVYGLRRGINLTSKDLENRFKELQKDGKLCCTENEFNDFIGYGLLLSTGNSYVSRYGNKLDVQVLKQKELRLNINLSYFVQNSKDLLLNSNTNKLYCMSSSTLQRYKDMGYIIEVKGKQYYRLFANELWLVYIIK